MTQKLKSRKALKSPDPWVFRDGRRAVSGPDIVARMRLNLRQLFASPTNRTLQLNALIAAGELESGLSDATSPVAPLFADITLALASLLLGGSLEPLPRLATQLEQVFVPSKLITSPPEGFNYYTLHPLDFAALASTAVEHGRPAAVIGVRSIGTTLSAVVAAQLGLQSSPVSRITLRPLGHPYSRTVQFTAEQTRWIQGQQEISAQFLVVDEGPGRSGSTFLSVAEALVKFGVGAEQITLLGSRNTDAGQLCAPEAKSRWSKFRFVSTTPSLLVPFRDHFVAGGGGWRSFFLPAKMAWPATWPQMERAKYISPDKKYLFKFEGLGAHGEAAIGRAQQLRKAGFSSGVEDAGGGFARYSIAKGRSLNWADVSADLLERIAAYCAFRATEFRVPQSVEPVAEMVRFNLMQDFGIEWNGELQEATHPILVDGHMQPHEWVQVDKGPLLKTDAVGHGDDHFFPGPGSIAWDLAGVAVEWDLPPNAWEFLLSKFERLSGEHLRPQLPAYLLAYAVFRASWCRMALTTVEGSEEEPRLRSAYKIYRERVFRSLEQSSSNRSNWGNRLLNAS